MWTLAAAALGGVLGNMGASKQNKAAAAQSAKQMAFQERMSNTAYTRSAKDLEKAGLNRILALGNPASTPGGSVAPVVNKISSAMQGAQTAAAVTNVAAQTKLTNATTQKSLDDNYIKHNAINLLRDFQSGKKTKPTTAKDSNVSSQPNSYADFLSTIPADEGGTAGTAKTTTPQIIGNDLPVMPEPGKPPNKSEFRKNRQNSPAGIRSARREALHRWQERYPHASQQDIRNAKVHIARKHPMP